MKKRFLLSYALLCLWSLGSVAAPFCLKQKEDTTAPVIPPPTPRVFRWDKIADSAQGALTGFFWNAAGKFFTLQQNTTAFNGNYWPNAHALDVLTDKYLRLNKDAATKQQMDALIAGVKAANNGSYINDYYDDMEWMLIATLRAYKETGDVRYKDVVDAIWPEVRGGWDTVSGGGFYWRKDRVNKNTPANAPAAIFAARLYQITKNADDLAWAKNTYNWLKAQLIQTGGDVWDGLFTNTNPITYDRRLYTYNYGTVIGAALELYKITNDQQYKADAIKVADQCIAGLSREGILPRGDNGDGGLFNGIFVRYLTRLVVEGGLADETKASYIAFLKKNAETMWTKGTLFPSGLISANWRNSSSSVTLPPQLSGTMLAESMAELMRLNLVQ